MPSPFARATERIDEQLATLATMQADISEQMGNVAAEIGRLQEHELTLLETYAARERRIDSLLDERLLSVSGKREAVRSR